MTAFSFYHKLSFSKHLSTTRSVFSKLASIIHFLSLAPSTAKTNTSDSSMKAVRCRSEYHNLLSVWLKIVITNIQAFCLK